jgi:hypothetical protein
VCSVTHFFFFLRVKIVANTQFVSRVLSPGIENLGQSRSRMELRLRPASQFSPYY